MTRRIAAVSTEPEQKPSWLVPLVLLGITVLLGAGILIWYLAPSVEQITGSALTPTANTTMVKVTIGQRAFAIPTNYIRSPAARKDGPAGAIDLDALLPDMRGYSEADQEAARDVTRDSPVVNLTLKAGTPAFSEADRFARIYLPNADPGKPAYKYKGFTVTPMAADSGYAGQQVFTRKTGDALVVLVCTADNAEHEIGGLCMREMPWGTDLTLNYAFRGGRLEEWEAIDTAVQALLKRLEPNR